jgi:hypothetical protein
MAVDGEVGGGVESEQIAPERESGARMKPTGGRECNQAYQPPRQRRRSRQVSSLF